MVDLAPVLNWFRRTLRVSVLHFAERAAVARDTISDSLFNFRATC